MDYNYSKYLRDLTGSDTSKRTDAVSNIYNEWYDCAKFYASNLDMRSEIIKCTKDFITSLLGSQGSNLDSSDKYVIIEMMNSFKQLFIILLTKPKFTSLCEGEDGISFIQWLSPNLIEILMSRLAQSKLENEKKSEILKVIESSMNLSMLLQSVNRELYSKYLFKINPEPLILITTNSNNFILRDISSKILKLYYKIYENNNSLLYYIKNVKDSFTLSVLWELPIFNSSDVVNLLISQLSLISNQQNSSEITTLVFTTLNEKLLADMSNKSDDDNKYIIDIEKYGKLIILICNHCYYTIFKHFNEKESEKPYEFLNIINTLLKICPNSMDIVHFAFNEPLSTRQIEILVNRSECFPLQIWNRFILPYIYVAIMKMNIGGRSGDFADQELINLLYECVRIYFINNTEKKNLKIEFGWKVYVTLIEAIKHGFIDTERFPELCSNILNYYYGIKEEDSKPINFIIYSFQDSVCINYKITRAICQIIFNLYEYSELDNSNNDKSFTIDDRIELLKVLAKIKTISINTFWTELCIKYKNVCYTNYKIIIDRIKVINDDIDRMSRDMSVNKQLLDSEEECLKEFININHPSLTYILFNTFVKLISLSNLINRNNTTTRGGYLATKESALIRLLESSSNNDSVCLDYNAVSFLMKYGSIDLRVAIARILPEVGLSDSSVKVRIMSLKVLSNVSYPLRQYGDKIIHSVSNINVEEKCGESSKMNINDISLYNSSSFVLAKLSVECPEYLLKCLKILIDGANITRDNDAQRKPSKEILDAFEYIFDRSNLNTIYDIYFENRNIIKFVENYCNKWKVVNEFKNKKVEDRIVNNWINEMNGKMIKGNYLEALYDIINIRNKCEGVYISNNLSEILNGKILPELFNKEFPLIEYYDGSSICKVDMKVINNFDRMYDIYKRMMLLCEEDCKRVLKLDKIMYDIILGIIYHIFCNEGGEKARNWLKEKNLNYGVMYDYISNWEYGKDNNLNLLKMVNNLPSMIGDNIIPMTDKSDNMIWKMFEDENVERMRINEISEEKREEINLNDINIFDENESENIFQNIPNYYK